MTEVPASPDIDPGQDNDWALPAELAFLLAGTDVPPDNDDQAEVA